MTLGQAIAERSIKGIIIVVDKALLIYSLAKPDVPSIETIHGAIPFTAIYDEDSKWQVIGAAYAAVVMAAAEIDGRLDLQVEQAKIIAGNAVLRNVSAKVTGIPGGLL